MRLHILTVHFVGGMISIMTVTPERIRALSLRGIFKDIPDEPIRQIIAEAQASFGGVKDKVLQRQLVELQAAHHLYVQLEREKGNFTDESPFLLRLRNLENQIPILPFMVI